MSPGGKPLVIFGATSFSRMTAYCIAEEGQREVAAFTVHRQWADEERLMDRPLLAFESLAEHHPPGACELLVTVGYSGVNRQRERLVREVAAAGYTLATWISSRASHWPNLVIGPNSMIHEHAVLQPFTEIGENVVVRSAAHLSHDTVVDDHAFISAGATLAGHVTVGHHAFVGVGATVRDGVSIAPDCVIAAGAVLVADTEPGGVYAGVPARRVREVADLQRI